MQLVILLVSLFPNPRQGDIPHKHAITMHIPYSLELMPPSIISPPPYFLLKYAAEVYLSPI